jgi:hypothetical protein
MQKLAEVDRTPEQNSPEHVHTHGAQRRRGRALMRLLSLPHRKGRSAPSIEEHAGPKPVLSYSSRQEDLRGKAIDLSEHEPLLSAEEVYKQSGLDLGALKVEIGLPQPQPWDYNFVKQMRLLCFEQARPAGQHGGTEPSYLMLTPEQLIQMRDAAQAGDAALWEEATRGAVVIDRNNPTHKIGRGSWLPHVGNETRLLDDPQTGNRYSNISRNQAIISMDEQGGLHVEDIGSKNGTNVYFAPATMQPQDPYAHAEHAGAVNHG